MLLETEVGVARNEPVTFAVRKAIEKGVVEVIREGQKKGLWKWQIEEVTSGFENGEDKPNIVVEQTPHKKVIESEKNVKTYEDYLEEKEAKKELEKKENTNEENNNDSGDTSILNYFKQ